MIIKDNKIFGVIDMGDAVYSFTIFDFAIALCYLILHCFEDIDANLSDVQIKTFVDAYEKQYRCLNDLELRMIYVIKQIMINFLFLSILAFKKL